MKIIGCIPAKGSSARIQSKNEQEVSGVPLFLWAANNLARVLPREDIYVDSDSDLILDRAHQHGFSVVKRPVELATNATDGNQLMLWEASQVDADVYIQHLPPMIFLREDTIRAGIEAIESDQASAFTVHRTQVYRWTSEGPEYDLDNIPNSFTLPETLIEGMGFYITRRDTLLEHRKRIVAPYAMLETDHMERIDIDYPDDLDFARIVARGLGPSSEWTSGISALRNASVRMLVMDVDGVLTDGGMYYSESGDEFKKFNTKDGLAIKRVVDSGIVCGLLSNGINESLIHCRAEHLNIQKIYVGAAEKLGVLESWRSELGLEWQDIAYIGDDVNDLRIFEKVGLSSCPADAVEAVRARADIVLRSAGGAACVREFIDDYLGWVMCK